MSNFHRKIIKSSMALLLIPNVTYLYQGYKKSSSPSTFELATENLGFKGYKKGPNIVSTKEHQEALLKILQMSGYFTPTKLWQGIKALNLEEPKVVFEKLYSAVKKSKLIKLLINLMPKYYVKILAKIQI